MLAQRFSRMNAPIRYAALDPAHAQAIYNFLKLQSRVYGIPEMMGSQENRQLLGNAHPLGMELAQQLHHGSDEAAQVLPDLMEEHGALPVVGGQHGGNLLFQLLHGMRNRLTAQNGGPDAGLVHGYGDESHREYSSEHGRELGEMGRFMRNLRQYLPGGHPAQASLVGLYHGLMDNRDATAMPAAYDAAQQHGSRGLQNHSLGLLNHMNDFMANHAGF